MKDWDEKKEEEAEEEKKNKTYQDNDGEREKKCWKRKQSKVS